MLLTALAVAIAAATLGAIIFLVNDPPERTAALSDFFRILGIIFAIDFLWALSYTIWPKKAARTIPAATL